MNTYTLAAAAVLTGIVGKVFYNRHKSRQEDNTLLEFSVSYPVPDAEPSEPEPEPEFNIFKDVPHIVEPISEDDSTPTEQTNEEEVFLNSETLTNVESLAAHEGDTDTQKTVRSIYSIFNKHNISNQIESKSISELCDIVKEKNDAFRIKKRKELRKFNELIMRKYPKGYVIHIDQKGKRCSSKHKSAFSVTFQSKHIERAMELINACIHKYNSDIFNTGRSLNYLNVLYCLLIQYVNHLHIEEILPSKDYDAYNLNVLGDLANGPHFSEYMKNISLGYKNDIPSIGLNDKYEIDHERYLEDYIRENSLDESDIDPTISIQIQADE